MRLTTHFALNEFVISQEAARRGIDNTPPADAVRNLEKVALTLEYVRDLFGRPVSVSSGYRCRKLNEAIGGSDTSDHCFGLAADFIVSGLSNYQVASRIANSSVRFDQLLLEYGWIHIGIGLRMRQQCLTKRSAKAPYETGIVL